MGGISWIAENWFVALNALGIIASLTFTGITLYSEAKTRRVAQPAFDHLQPSGTLD